MARSMKKQQVALLSGAAGDIGRAIALALHGEGYAVAVSDLEHRHDDLESIVEDIRHRGGTAMSLIADVTAADQVQEAVETVSNEFDGFDVMINNAGVCRPRPFLELTESDLEFTFRVNVYGVLYGIQAAARKFIEHGTSGRIISAASISGFRGNADLAHYSATKFAVRGLTQAASRSLGGHGITVNAYAPGIVAGEMWTKIDKQLSEDKHMPVGESLKKAGRDIALGRLATPADVSRVVTFLADPRSSYVTGQVIVVDGGLIYN